MTALAILIIFIISILFLFQRPIGLYLFEQGSEARIGRDNLAELSDGLHIGLCGTGSPLPDPIRAGPCNIIIAGKQIFVVDIGEGGTRNISLMGINTGKIDALLLTHFHSDHIDGIGPLMLMRWTNASANKPLSVYGPTGLVPIIDGFNAAYSKDHDYRVKHHGEKIMPPKGAGALAKPFTIGSNSKLIFKRKELKITAFKVNHDPIKPAIGYRFDYKGRSLVISGDTARSKALEQASKGADLLVHEALQPNMVKEITNALNRKGLDNITAVTRDILDYHASPEDAAASAKAAGVKQLVLSHIVPSLPSRYFYPAFLGDAHDHYDGPIIIGEDGMFFTLPANSNAIEYNEFM